jgi:hypothetical protein
VVSSSGFEGKIYLLKENTERLPKLEKMQPAGSIYTTSLNVWPQRFDEGFPGISDRVEWFAIDYTTRIWIETPGRYRFSLLSDDGAKLMVGNKLVVDNDWMHHPQACTGSAELTRGVHRLRVSYFQGPRFTVALVLAIARPGEGWRILNTDDFAPPKDPGEWIDGKVRDVRVGSVQANQQ